MEDALPPKDPRPKHILVKFAAQGKIAIQPAVPRGHPGKAAFCRPPRQGGHPGGQDAIALSHHPLVVPFRRMERMGHGSHQLGQGPGRQHRIRIQGQAIADPLGQGMGQQGKGRSVPLGQQGHQLAQGPPLPFPAHIQPIRLLVGAPPMQIVKQRGGAGVLLVQFLHQAFRQPEKFPFPRPLGLLPVREIPQHPVVTMLHAGSQHMHFQLPDHPPQAFRIGDEGRHHHQGGLLWRQGVLIFHPRQHGWLGPG